MAIDMDKYLDTAMGIDMDIGQLERKLCMSGKKPLEVSHMVGTHLQYSTVKCMNECQPQYKYFLNTVLYIHMEMDRDRCANKMTGK